MKENYYEKLLNINTSGNENWNKTSPHNHPYQPTLDVYKRQVNHLVSTVVGTLKDEYNAVDVIKATFPGGSITGAPKIRSMEIIEELEPTKRNVYTGSIGYIGFDGNMDLNIAIRTIVKENEDVYFQVGGGMTWGSNPVSYTHLERLYMAIFNIYI